MQELIDLLNKYEKEIKKSEYYEWEKWIWWPNNLFRRNTRDEEWSHIYSNTADTYVISKKYGFIKWLVDNDKIDLYKLEDNNDYSVMKENWATTYKALLVLLSIQNNPIEYLVSILE